MPTKYKYKVVKRKTRMSAIVNGNSKYAKKYVKGERIFANENTLGIMVFKTKKEAENWTDPHPFWFDGKYRDLIVLRVIPIGRGKMVGSISYDVSTDGLDYYYNKNVFNSQYKNWPPENTIAYTGVLVVD